MQMFPLDCTLLHLKTQHYVGSTRNKSNFIVWKIGLNVKQCSHLHLVSALFLLLCFCEDLAAPPGTHQDILFGEPRAENTSVGHYAYDHVVESV